jgi:aldehyde dehydrogenase (NAD+)
MFGKSVLANDVIEKTTSGSVGVKMSMMVFAHPAVQFGGVGWSGDGGARGFAGFAAFSHMHQVLRVRVFPFHLVFPPYTKMTRRLTTVFKRIVRF